MAEAVERHGVSVYHGLLFGTIGSRVAVSLDPQSPMTGVVGFLQAQMGSALAVVDQPSAFGRSAEEVYSSVLVQASGSSVVGKALPRDCFPLYGATAGELVARALEDEPRRAPERAELAKYLSRSATRGFSF